MDGSHTEIECKLVAKAPSEMSGLDPLVRRLCEHVEDEGTTAIEDVYLDTADWRLHRRGFACRVRYAGGSATLTTKSLTPHKRQLSMREEYEEVLAEPPGEPFEEVPCDRLGRRVCDMTDGRPLRELFRIRNERRLFRVQYGRELKAEVCADEFEIVAGDTRRAFAEVEIEMTEGDPDTLRAFSRRIADALGLEMGGRSKFITGLEIAGLTPPGK